ncbi:hypothetical protein Tco_0407979, partial [Tanacetum coccineum]
TKIHVDNESAICVVKNHVYHSKTEHIEIRHHFIRDSYEKRLIEMVKIHTDHIVADLLTKAFDVSRFNFLVTSIGKRRWDTKISQSGGPPIKVVDKVVHKELGDIMERAATTASSLEVEHDSDREIEITATIDGRLKTVTKASIRRHLKLEDSVGSTIPVDSQNTPTVAPSTSQPTSITPITTPETSPSKITSSPSLSSPIQQTPLSMHTTHDAEDAIPMPHELPLHSVHSLGRDKGSLSLFELTVPCTNLSNKVTSLEEELAQTKKTYGTVLTKLIKKVKKLEQTVKSTQARRRFRIVVSDDEEGTSWIQEDIEIQEKIISTAAENLVYIKRSAEKKKDKGKGIMTESEPEKKTKTQLEQEILGHEEAVRLQEQLNEEETQRIARDVEIARQLHEEINKTRQKRVVAKDVQAHVIDWSNPAMLRYHALQNRPYSVAKVRKNMIMYLKHKR